MQILEYLFLTVTLCTGTGTSQTCDAYVIDSMPAAACQAEITTETMSYRVEQITLLDSFYSVECPASDSKIKKAIFLGGF